MTPAKTARHNPVGEAVRAVLPSSAKVHATKTDHADLIVNGVPVAIKWVGEGWLGDVQPLLASRRNRPDIVVARRMSPGARVALSEAGIGWVDQTGAAEIVLGPIVVSRTGQPVPPATRPPRWTPSVLAVAEALLCGTRATVAAAGEATGLSTGSCTSALRILTDLGFLSARAKRGRASARRVSDEGRLLDAYAAAAASMTPKASLQIGVTWRDVIVGLAETGKTWDRARVAWAVTGAAASLMVAPYLASVSSAEVYVEAGSVVELQGVATDAGLRPIEGGRLTLRPFPTVTTRRLATEIDGLRVAPWPRIYADLRTTGVRGEESAEHLRVMHDR